MSEKGTRSHTRGHLYRAVVHPEERRLRAGWRLLCYGLLFFAATPVSGLSVAMLSRVWPGGLPPWAGQSLFRLLDLAIMLLVTWLARRVLDRRSFPDLGLRLRRCWWADLLFGLVLGGVLMAGIALGSWVAGCLQFQGFAWETMEWQQVLLRFSASSLLYVAVGIKEELTIRGYVLRNLTEGLNLPLAVLLSSALFGLLHLGNPHASLVSTLNLTVAGVFLSAGVLVTRSLWLSIGLHFGWNLFQGTIFGFPVSGTGGFHLVQQTAVGPEAWTGGSFGPEAGLTGLLAMIVGTGLVWLWGLARRRMHDPG